MEFRPEMLALISCRVMFRQNSVLTLKPCYHAWVDGNCVKTSNTKALSDCFHASGQTMSPILVPKYIDKQ